MLTFTYDDRSLIEDAGNLIIHHVKRQTGKYSGILKIDIKVVFELGFFSVLDVICIIKYSEVCCLCEIVHDNLSLQRLGRT